MAFPNLETRFNATMDQLYGRYSTGDSVEYKPNNPSRENVNGDSRIAPIGSVQRDLSRIGQYLLSSNGVKFLAMQQFLQTGNAISETRLINPLFIIGNVVPYLHLNRSLRTQADDVLSNTSKSPASTSNIGKEGRLQRETAQAAQARLTGTPSALSLLQTLLSPSKLAQTVLGIVQGIGGDGTLGVDERPELNINGEYYSIMQWKGYQPSANAELSTVLDALRQAGSIVKSVGLTNSLLGSLGGLFGGIPAPANPMAPATGMRYFLTDENQAIRYINNTSILDRQPVILGDPPQSTKAALTELSVPDTALENRYAEDNRLSFLRDHLDAQKTKLQGEIADFTLRGVLGGLNEVTTQAHQVQDSTDFQNLVSGLTTRPDSPNSTTATDRTGYYLDRLNSIGVVDGASVPQTTLAGLQDYIKFSIYDVVNNKLLPFRAMLSQISETTTPDFAETKYIGRIERNIVYKGTTRSLQLTLTVAVFSPSELQPVWQKVNYLTGLTFPAQYANGFLIPPIIRLTLGDYYSDQPGYISQFTHTFDDAGTTWEVEDGFQVPKTFEMGLTFSVIEKDAMSAGSAFYGFGTSITA